MERFNESGTLRLQLAGPICVITIDRPDRRNALTQAMWKTIGDWTCNLPTKTRFLVIRGAGREFTAGSDIKEFATLSVASANQAFETMEETISRIETLPLPTIASISGPAYGAGFVLALACDIRVGTERAQFGMPVGKLGITLQAPFLRRMVDNIGPSRAKDMVYTARTYDATEALQLGILNYVVAPESIDSETIAICRKMAQQSRASLLAVKANVNALTMGQACETGNWVDDADFKEGVQAFTEKRSAAFR